MHTHKQQWFLLGKLLCQVQWLLGPELSCPFELGPQHFYNDRVPESFWWTKGTKDSHAFLDKRQCYRTIMTLLSHGEQTCGLETRIPWLLEASSRRLLPTEFSRKPSDHSLPKRRSRGSFPPGIFPPGILFTSTGKCKSTFWLWWMYVELHWSIYFTYNSIPCIVFLFFLFEQSSCNLDCLSALYVATYELLTVQCTALHLCTWEYLVKPSGT